MGKKKPKKEGILRRGDQKQQNGGEGREKGVGRTTIS